MPPAAPRQLARGSAECPCGQLGWSCRSRTPAGREAFATNYLIKTLAESGVEIVKYLTPKQWHDKLTGVVRHH